MIHKAAMGTFAGLATIGLAGLLTTSAIAAEPSHGAPAKPAASHGAPAPAHGAPPKQVAAAPAHGAAKKSGGAPHWTYAGKDGPANWGDLSPAFKACSMGVQQSPINLHNAIGSEIGSVTVSYRSTAFEVVNNGHTIQVNVEAGSSIMLDGVDYKLLQFHFHTPSEHLKDGKPFKMEAHFVHISDTGVLAVLGVFIESGKTNSLLAPIWGRTHGGEHVGGGVGPPGGPPAAELFHLGIVQRLVLEI